MKSTLDPRFNRPRAARAMRHFFHNAARVLLLFALVSFVILSCEKTGGSEQNADPLLVNFPAVYVVLGQSSDLAVINLETLELAGTLPLLRPDGSRISWPHHISLSSDGRRIAVSAVGSDLSEGHGGHGGGDGGSVLLIDPVDGSPLASRDLPVAVHNAAFSSDGSEVWFAEMGEPSVVHIADGHTLQDEMTLPAEEMSAEVTFSSDGHLAFVANGGSGNVTVFDTGTRSVARTITVGETPVGAWPASNGWMFVDNEDSRSISVFHHDSMVVQEVIELGFKPGFAAHLEERNELWVSNATAGSVVVFAQSDSGWTRRVEISTGADAHAIVFTADGALGLITNQGARTVSVIDTERRLKLRDIVVGDKPNGLALREE